VYSSMSPCFAPCSQKAEIRARAAEVEKKAEEEAEFRRQREAEKAAKMAESKRLALEAKAKREQEATAGKSPSKADDKPKASKFGEVQKINKQAERIATGDKPPEFFWGGN
jgi:membrane protein involved in colicin uptake